MSRFAILFMALLLASCAARPQFAPACPVPGLVKPLSELTRYRNGVPDIGQLVIQARIADIQGSCKPGEAGAIAVSARVAIDAMRGPAMTGRVYELPVFVAVTDAQGVRDKVIYNLKLEFPANIDRAAATSPEIAMSLPVTQQKSGAAYGIVAGFQVTPDEREALRRGRRP